VQKQAWADNVMPPVEHLQPGLWSVPVPIPDNPLRYVLVYVFELGDGPGGGGVGIVDAGWPTDDAWEALTTGLVTCGFDVADVKAVLVTHMHPDHFGLAGRVREASGAWVGMHAADSALLERRYDSVSDLIDTQRKVMAASGVPADELPELSEASMGIRQFMSSTKPDRALEDGTDLDLPGWNLRVVWTPGHSPGHVCFYETERRLLLSGDHVLPRITSNIAAHPQQRDNPLADFFDSLQKVKALDVGEVLPAHEYRFRNLGVRVDQLVEHHSERLAEIESVLRANPGSNTWEITLDLTWSRPWDQIPTYMRRAANGETLAHLKLLQMQDRVVMDGDSPARWYVPAENR
jgi:glyoxylase-like metal-dependent hydrolase (beta-lactamase superfamily II)